MRDRWINTTKEERAKDLNNIVCPRCKYQNHFKMIKIYGTCKLCGCTLSSDYFKKKMRSMIKNG